MSKTKLGTFEDLMELTASDMQPIAGELRGVVVAVDPDATKVVRHPTHLMEGTGAAMRHVKMRSVMDASRPAVRRLIDEAVSERRQALGK